MSPEIWGLSLVLWPLALGLLGQKSSGSGCKSPIKLAVGVWALDWVAGIGQTHQPASFPVYKN